MIQRLALYSSKHVQIAIIRCNLSIFCLLLGSTISCPSSFVHCKKKMKFPAPGREENVHVIWRSTFPDLHMILCVQEMSHDCSHLLSCRKWGLLDTFQSAGNITLSYTFTFVLKCAVLGIFQSAGNVRLTYTCTALWKCGLLGTFHSAGRITAT